MRQCTSQSPVDSESGPEGANSSYKSSAWYPVLAVGLSMVGFILIKTGRDAVFFSQGGLRQLPAVYVLMAIFAIPAAMIHLEVMKLWGARRARIRVFVAIGLTFMAFVPIVSEEQRIAMLTLFVFVPVAFAALFAAAWLLAADLLEGADASTVRWAYARIGASSMLGGVIGGLMASGLSVWAAPRFLVASGAVVLLAVAAVISRAHRSHPLMDSSLRDRQSPKDGTLEQEADEVQARPLTLMRNPYIQGLVGVSALGAVAGLFIDFQFYAIATLNGHVDAGFFAGFYTILNLASLGLQLVVAPWIQARHGVGGALLILPLALLGGAGLVTLSATVLSRSVLKVTEGGLKAAVHRSVWEQVFLPIGRAGREMAKVMVDGLFARISEGLAAAGLYLWLSRIPILDSDLNLSWINWVLLGVVLLWLILTRQIGTQGQSSAEGSDPMIRLPDS